MLEIPGFVEAVAVHVHSMPPVDRLAAPFLAFEMAAVTGIGMAVVIIGPAEAPPPHCGPWPGFTTLEFWNECWALAPDWFCCLFSIGNVLLCDVLC